jgi:hypothetical protein
MLSAIRSHIASGNVLSLMTSSEYMRSLQIMLQNNAITDGERLIFRRSLMCAICDPGASEYSFCIRYLYVYMT